MHVLFQVESKLLHIELLESNSINRCFDLVPCGSNAFGGPYETALLNLDQTILNRVFRNDNQLNESCSD